MREKPAVHRLIRSRGPDVRSIGRRQSPHGSGAPNQADRAGTARPAAAWRAVWGAQRANPVYAARYQSLTSREHNKLTPRRRQ